MRELAATWMRGGTSKCWVFDRADLDALGLDTAAVLLRAFGSPDPRQVDGIGGATSTTSKAVILAPSSAGDADVDYTFAQVGIEEPVVDWGSNCGNCSAVVAPFALSLAVVPLRAECFAAPREGEVPAGPHAESEIVRVTWNASVHARECQRPFGPEEALVVPDEVVLTTTPVGVQNAKPMGANCPEALGAPVELRDASAVEQVDCAARPFAT